MNVEHILWWILPGAKIKRWIVLFTLGMLLILSASFVHLAGISLWGIYSQIIAFFVLILGIATVGFAAWSLALRISSFYNIPDSSTYEFTGNTKQRQRGPAIVAIGGGTGLPSAIRALKTETTNLTAIVTVADDGGSSGRLRRELGVLPPGDLRNNIVALADDENLMAKLFQYRFTEGDLEGHSFGNLFISALSSITEGGLETALIETARVLNIQGRVLPSTLEEVNLRALVTLPGKNRSVNIFGEAAITDAGGNIEHLEMVPSNAAGYRESVNAILNADLITIGPGSLFTSIMPNLLVADIASALRATQAYTIYICNVATQEGETENFTVAEHVTAIETHIGHGVIQAVLANDAYPTPPANSKTRYVTRAPENHQIMQNYDVFYTDLTDEERPWRHSPEKLRKAIMVLYEAERSSSNAQKNLFAERSKSS